MVLAEFFKKRANILEANITCEEKYLQIEKDSKELWDKLKKMHNRKEK